MDKLAKINPAALGIALAVAIAVLAIGVWLDALLRRRLVSFGVQRKLMPLALMAGFVAGYAYQYRFPASTETHPWYLDEAWMMTVVGVIVAGVMVVIARLLPRAMGLGVMVLTAVGLAFLMVRGPWTASEAHPAWEAWNYYFAFTVAAVVCYGVALFPAEREGALWLVGVLTTWATASAAGVATMVCFDLGLGKLFVLLAVLAGVAGVAGILPALRQMAAGAGLFLATALAVLLTITARQDSANGWPMVKSGLFLMSAGPLGAAVAWIPALRRRPWLCVLAAFGVALLFIIPGAILALSNAAPLPDE